jgi:hypothetical protein
VIYTSARRASVRSKADVLSGICAKRASASRDASRDRPTCSATRYLTMVTERGPIFELPRAEAGALNLDRAPNELQAGASGAD